ncbi:MAG: AMP-binding protein, partial [Bryobacteraceae bacterium]
GAQVVPVWIDGAVHSVFSRMKTSAAVPIRLRLFPKIRITMFPPSTIPMPEARRPRDRRRIASEKLRRVMQEAGFRARRTTTIFEDFLNTVDAQGRGRGVMEDLRETEETYGQILRASLALGRIVSKLTEENERVGVLMPNVNATVSLVLGMLSQRRVPAMLNYTSGAEGMQHACKIATIKVVIASRAFVEKAKLGHMLEKLQGINLIYLEDVRPMFTLGDKLWLMLWALRFPRAVMKQSQPDDAAAVLFTSGSEGKPKGVVLSHRSILANHSQMLSVIDVTARDKFLCALPLFHSFGLCVGALFPLLAGSRIFLYPSPLHYRVIPEILYDRDCTVMFATSTFLGNYAKFAHPLDFRSLRYVVSGAEKLHEEVRHVYYEKFGVRILEGYGATECSPVVSANTPAANHPGTVGEIFPGMEYRVAPIPGIVEGGELHVRGPNIMLGYFKEKAPGVIEPPESEFGPGWYDTGDVVSVDDNRAITILGRLKRFAKVAGEMVSLESVERIATAASPKHHHAASSWKDLQRGELIALFTEDPDLKREHLQTAAREIGLPEIAIPRRVIHIDKLPLLGNGKRDYVALGMMAEEYVKKETVKQ